MLALGGAQKHLRVAMWLGPEQAPEFGGVLDHDLPPTVLDAINMTCPPTVHDPFVPTPGRARPEERRAGSMSFDRGVGGGGGDGNEPREGEHVLEGFWDGDAIPPPRRSHVACGWSAHGMARRNSIGFERPGSPTAALRKEVHRARVRDPEGRPHDLAPCTLEPWAELQRGRDGALAGRPPGPGAAPHAARHI